MTEILHRLLGILLLTSCMVPNTTHAKVTRKVALKANQRAQKPAPLIQKSVPVVQNDKVLCIPMPKCGTHLVLKCLTLLGQPGIHSKYDGAPAVERYRPKGALLEKMNRLNQFDPPYHYKGEFHIPSVGPVPTTLVQRMGSSKQRLFWMHWPYTKEAEAQFFTKTMANFFIIRDPRDMIVSMAFMVKDSFDGRSYPVVEDLVYDFIDGRQKHYIRWGVEVHSTYPLLWELGVVGFYKLYLPWMNARKFHTVYFERLIGSKGGGSDEIQMEEIRLIAQHIGVKLSPSKVKEIRDSLFGGTSTFREGKSGGWKNFFTPEMKQAFKNTPGANELLIALGYEKDTNW